MNVAAILFTAIFCKIVLTIAQDCETARNIIARENNGSVNCSSVLSRVNDSITRFGSTRRFDLDIVCTSSNITCQNEIMDYFTACGSLDEAV